MKTLLKERWPRIVLLSAVFLLFLCSAAGLVDFNFAGGAGLQFRGGGIWQPGQGLTVPPVARSAEFVTLLLVGAAMCVGLPFLSPIRASMATAAAVIPPLYLGLTAPPVGTLLPMEFSLLTVGMIYGLNVLAGYFVETHAKQKIIGIFGQYVPPELVREISRQPGHLSMEGESRPLTVFFCDLQNFSSVGEQLNPKQLALLLNEYFTEMTEVLFRYGATIDKYIGDSIMAFWGAPIPQADHARRAVLAAFDMHGVIKGLQRGFVRRGWPAPNMGIGINTGTMNVGNMGSRYRVAYTVIGDAVNLASRLETLTRTYHVPTIVSEITRGECPGVLFRSLDIVQVRGRHNRTKIYQPVCLEQGADESAREALARHEQAMDHYFAGRWNQATAALERLRDAHPDDRFYPAILRKVEEQQRG